MMPLDSSRAAAGHELLQSAVSPRGAIAALKFFHQAIRLSEPCAYHFAGLIQITRKWGIVRPERAVCYFAWGSQRGCRDCLFHLGEHYWHGRGVPRDGERACKLFTSSALSGNAAAFRLLGQILREDSFGRLQFHRKPLIATEQLARAYFRLAADLGDAQGAFILACTYSDAEGDQFDEEKALQSFHWAARMGHSGAMNNAGSILERKGCLAGNGVELLKQAASLYRKAYGAGEPLGAYNMGRLYKLGLGVERDRNAAVRFFLGAARMGHTDSLRELIHACSAIPLSPLISGEVLGLAKRAAKSGSAVGEELLALCHEYGVGI